MPPPLFPHLEAADHSTATSARQAKEQAEVEMVYPERGVLIGGGTHRRGTEEGLVAGKGRPRCQSVYEMTRLYGGCSGNFSH